MEVKIKGEADASELREVIYAFGHEVETETFLTHSVIKKCLGLLPKAIGYCMAHSAPAEDDSYRLEMSNGLIIHAVPREGRSGVAFGHPFTTPEHWDLYVKFSGRALEAIGEQLHGWVAKNG